MTPEEQLEMTTIRRYSEGVPTSQVLATPMEEDDKGCYVSFWDHLERVQLLRRQVEIHAERTIEAKKEAANAREFWVACRDRIKELESGKALRDAKAEISRLNEKLDALYEILREDYSEL